MKEPGGSPRAQRIDAVLVSLPRSGRQLGGVERVVGVQPRVRAPAGPRVRGAPAPQRRQILRGPEPGVRELHRGALHSR